MQLKLFGRINQTTVSPLGEFENDDVQLSCFVSTPAVERGQTPSPAASDEDIERQYPVFAFSVPRSSWQQVAQFDAQPLDRRWFDIRVEVGGSGPEILVLGDGDSPDKPFHLVEVTPAKAPAARLLQKLVEAPFRGSRTTLAIVKRLLAKARIGRAPLDASVVDVGQGSLVALHGLGQWPSIYFDLGWPINANLGGAPAVRPALRDDSAPVVLSHWDWDHWGLARDHAGWSKGSKCWRISWNAVALNRPWFVPGFGTYWGDTQIGPLDWRLAVALWLRGHLFVWPSKLMAAHVDRFSIYRPSGGPSGDVNQHGLVLVVDNLKVAQRGGVTPRALLCPGDADYRHLPFLKAGTALTYEFAGLVATHHGAKFTKTVIPPPHFPACLAYSVGHRNIHSHPVQDAQLAYLKAGWNVHVHTTNRVHRSGAGAGCPADGGVLLSTHTDRVLPATASGAFWLGKQ